MSRGRFDGVEGVVIALSGGPDSAAVAALAREAGICTRAVHVDHGLPASPAMRAAAIAVAEKLGIQLEVVEVRPAGTSETELRAARYEALLEHVGPNETIVTGHTSDDQAETVLMNLFRGAGPRGLAGIPARRGQFQTWKKLTEEEVFKNESKAKYGDLGISENSTANLIRNFLDCIKSREKPIADVEIGHRSAILCHLGNIARWLGRSLQWDRQAAGRSTRCKD